MNFISWVSFRDYLANLMVMVFHAARIPLEAQAQQNRHVSFDTLKASFNTNDVDKSFANDVAIFARLKRDVHNITTGIVGVGEAFTLIPASSAYACPSELDFKTSSMMHIHFIICVAHSKLF